MYIIAAVYEFDDRNDIGMARKYFAEGLKYHQNCKNLYVEEFWVEVQNLEKTPGTSCRIAVNKYRNFIKHFEGDMEFHFSLVDKAIKFRTVGELQCYVVRYKCVLLDNVQTLANFKGWTSLPEPLEISW